MGHDTLLEAGQSPMRWLELMDARVSHCAIAAVISITLPVYLMFRHFGRQLLLLAETGPIPLV